jgi:hypothetical protein
VPDDPNLFDPIYVTGQRLTDNSCGAGCTSGSNAVIVGGSDALGGGSGEAGGGGGPSPPAPPPPPPPPRPTPPTQKEKICSAIAGGVGLYALQELGEVARELLKGQNALEIIVKVGRVEASSNVLAAVGIASLVVYAADELSGGKVTEAVSDTVGCPK